MKRAIELITTLLLWISLIIVLPTLVILMTLFAFVYATLIITKHLIKKIKREFRGK